MINLTNIQTEVDASYLYAILAAKEKDSTVAAIFKEMSDIERSHALSSIKKNGMSLDHFPKPSFRAKLIKRFGNWFGSDFILGILLNTEKSLASSIHSARSQTNTKTSLSDTAHVCRRDLFLHDGVAADVYRPRTHNTCEGCKNASLQINKTQEQLSSNSGCLWYSAAGRWGVRNWGKSSCVAHTSEQDRQKQIPAYNAWNQGRECPCGGDPEQGLWKATWKPIAEGSFRWKEKTTAFTVALWPSFMSASPPCPSRQKDANVRARKSGRSWYTRCSEREATDRCWG